MNHWITTGFKRIRNSVKPYLHNDYKYQIKNTEIDQAVKRAYLEISKKCDHIDAYQWAKGTYLFCRYYLASKDNTKEPYSLMYMKFLEWSKSLERTDRSTDKS